MNVRVRQAVKQAMQERGITQEELAKMTAIERTNINALLNGKTGKVPERWQRILDALDLQLGVIAKDG